MSEEILKETTVAATTEIAKDAYLDVAHPAADATGQILSLIPRAINAALLPLHQWVLQKENNIAETKKLLEEKLKNVAPDKIVSPESYVAVPALQAIAYSMNNDEIRNMYANLLASSMIDKIKGDVHPAFVEIIKQISPDEARILRFVYQKNASIPVISLFLKKENGKGKQCIIKFFNRIHRMVPDLEVRAHSKVSILIDNLVRLKLVEIHDGTYLVDDKLYEVLKNDPFITSHTNQNAAQNHKWDFEKTYMDLTFLGKSFCHVCVNDTILPIGVI